jgi:hypothetical protein
MRIFLICEVVWICCFAPLIGDQRMVMNGIEMGSLPIYLRHSIVANADHIDGISIPSLP